MKFIFAILAIAFALVAVANAQDEKEQYRKAREAIFVQYPSLKELYDTYNGELSFLVKEGRNDPKCSDPIMVKYESDCEAVADSFIKGAQSANAAVNEEIKVVLHYTVLKLQRCLVEEFGGTFDAAKQNFFDSHPKEYEKVSNLLADIESYISIVSIDCKTYLISESKKIHKKLNDGFSQGRSTMDEVAWETLTFFGRLKDFAKTCDKNSFRGF